MFKLYFDDKNRWRWRMVTPAGHCRYLIGGDDCIGCPFKDSGWYSSDKLYEIEKFKKTSESRIYNKNSIEMNGNVTKNVYFNISNFK